MDPLPGYFFRNNAVIKTKKENWINELSPLLCKLGNLRRILDIRWNVGYRGVRDYLKENKSLVIWLAVITVAAYGFELFNFNLTIDEEISFYKSYAWLWNSEGRWAMYLIEISFSLIL